MDEIKLKQKDGKIVVSSRNIAEHFEKAPKHVNEAIRKLMVENSTVKNMFTESQYKSNRGRYETEFLVDRDGFSLLAMGFTGKKALEWKLKYINAFNAMEEKLKSSDLLSEEEKLKLQLFSKDPMEVVSAHNKLIELATRPLAKTIAQQQPKVEYHDEVLRKDGLITTTVVAKDLGFNSATKLNQVMNANRIIYKNKSGVWCPYANYEWLISDRYADYQSYKEEKAKLCLKWTEKGRKWIVENYNNWVMKLTA